MHYVANLALADLAVELMIYESKEGFCGAYIEKGLGLVWAKSKRNKFCGRKIAYTGHFCPSTGTDKSAKLMLAFTVQDTTDYRKLLLKTKYIQLSTVESG